MSNLSWRASLVALRKASSLSKPTLGSRALTFPPNSTSDFSDKAHAGKLVDKSHAILDFLRAGQAPVHLLLRPRHSGKTTLLNMFRAFFENSNTRELNKKLFLDNQLKITNYPEFENEFGKSPVLYLNLKSVIGKNMDELLKRFRSQVSGAVRELDRTSDFFRERKGLHQWDLRLIDGILGGELENWEWPDVLYDLSRILFTLSGKRVIVLIDEYETPLMAAVEHGYFSKANIFFRIVFIELLKDNQYLRGALLAGIMPIPATGWLSSVNNILVYTLDEHKYSTACMFTEDEVRMLYERQRLEWELAQETVPFQLENLDSWYNGYSTFDNKKLFNPRSVVAALSAGKLQSFWVKSSHDIVIDKHIAWLLEHDNQFCADINCLLMGESVAIPVQPVLAHRRIADLPVDDLWSLIYHAGYVTQVGIQKTEPQMNNWSLIDISSQNVVVRIPNHEIRTIFLDWLLNHCSHPIVSEAPKY